MIWVRRILTVPFGVVLLVLLLLAVVLLQVSDTFLSPKFYRDRLREVDIYRFALNELATSALDEARQVPPSKFDSGLDENPLVTSGLTTEDLVSSLNRALPPEWVQDLVEQVLDEPAKYITGDRDDFLFTLKVGDRVVQVVEEAKTLMRRADAYGLLFEQLEVEIEKALETELPFGIDVTSERLVESIRRVVSREWVEENVETVLDAVTPYAIGDTDSFEIRIELADRVDIALEEVKLLLREADAYELLYDEVVDPIVSENIGAVAALPFGVEVSSDEVLAALRQVAPVEWVQEQAEGIIDAVGRYATKRSNNLEIIVDIRDNKAEARRVLVEAARDKFEQIIGALPDCTAAQTTRMLTSGLQGIPECLPGGEAARKLVRDAFDALSEEIESAVDTLVLAQVPDRITFTSADLEAALQNVGAADNFELLEDTRDIIGDGLTYTDIDLKADLIKLDGPEAVDLLEEIRSFLADGWTYTEQDLREEIDFTATSELGLGGYSTPSLDSGRKWLSRARTFRLLVYVPVALVLLFIGVLGGRTWRGRLGWAAGYLAVTAAIILSVFGPVYGALVDNGIDELHTRALADIDITHDFQQTQQLAIDKGFELFEAIANTFASGVANKSALILALSLIAMGTAIFWPALRGLARRDGEPAPGSETG
jgi:hypothetical protein